MKYLVVIGGSPPRPRSQMGLDDDLYNWGYRPADNEWRTLVGEFDRKDIILMAVFQPPPLSGIMASKIETEARKTWQRLGQGPLSSFQEGLESLVKLESLIGQNIKFTYSLKPSGFVLPHAVQEKN